jgi:sensor histidine kinase YesM
LEIEKYRFDFNFSIDIDDKLDTFETQIPTMLIQPFVENAVKHGVSSRPPGAGMIRIAFIQDADNYLRCTVEDNGIGIEINRQIKANAGQKNHESKALSITHDRLELIAEQRGREATQTIEQISPEGGTLVTIRLPL